MGMSTNCETAPSLKLINSERLAVSPTEAARLIGIGRTLLYQLIDDGRLRSIKINGRRLITMDAIREFLVASEVTP
jgi:excisionase family DNA binding protein